MKESTQAGKTSNARNMVLPHNQKNLNFDNLSDEISGLKLGQLFGPHHDKEGAAGATQQLILHGQRSGEQLSKAVGPSS